MAFGGKSIRAVSLSGRQLGTGRGGSLDRERWEGVAKIVKEIQDLVRGMPVDVAQINRSLKALWEQEGTVLTRASLINFAVYSEAPDALSANTQLMEQVTREHACRIILLAVNPAASKQRVQAWISAHCHVTGASLSS